MKRHAWKWAQSFNGRARCKNCPATTFPMPGRGPRGGDIMGYRARPGADVTTEAPPCRGGKGAGK